MAIAHSRSEAPTGLPRHLLSIPAIGLALAALLVWPSVSQANCGAAFCSLSTDWAGQGVWTEPGFRVDVRYEIITQDTVHKGADEVDAEEGNGETKTENRNLILTVDYAISEQWAVAVSVPYVDRTHEHENPATEDGHDHVAANPRYHTVGPDTPAEQRWSFQELGDIRIVGRYVFASEHEFMEVPRSYGVEFGLKLPTGATDIANDEGDEAERSIQPGSGTTDLILGGFVSQQFAGGNSSAFGKVALQEALAEASGFAPGTRLTLDGGYRYQVTPTVGLLAQLNLLWKDNDSGDEAEEDDSGGTFVFASPGVSVGVGNSVQVYGFYQLPLYQNVNGVQLTADDGVVIGVGARF